MAENNSKSDWVHIELFWIFTHIRVRPLNLSYETKVIPLNSRKRWDAKGTCSTTKWTKGELAIQNLAN